MSVVVSRKIILGSRGSELARAQTSMVTAALRQAWPELEVVVEIIKTRGDEQSAQRIDVVDPRAGRKGLFTGEIERVLAAGEIDVAVHSAKDLPSDVTSGLEVYAVLPRAAVDDILVGKAPGGLASLRPTATVATGSVRRQYQLRWKHPEIQIVDLHGNVPTRLRKLLTNSGMRLCSPAPGLNAWATIWRTVLSPLRGRSSMRKSCHGMNFCRQVAKA